MPTNKESCFRGLGRGIVAKQQRLNSIEVYRLSPTRCKKCSVGLSYEKRKNIFCSHSCAASINNVGVHRHPPVLNKRTRKPRINYKLLTIGEYRHKVSVLNKHPSWVHAHVRDFARNWNKHLRKLSCQYCEYNKHVELAHIIPISKFPDTAILGEINSEENLLVLCPNHHWEFDKGILLLKDIPKR